MDFNVKSYERRREGIREVGKGFTMGLNRAPCVHTDTLLPVNEDNSFLV